MTSYTSPDDVIKAAASIARDAADGRLAPTELEHQAVTELRELVGEVVGPGDPVWDLQVQIARGVLAVGGIPADELAEWLAVQRALEAPSILEQPDPDQVPPTLQTLPTEELSAEEAQPDADADDEREASAEPDETARSDNVVIPQHRADGYDPLRGWGAAKNGFVG